VGCLLPVLDVLNHRPGARVSWERRAGALAFVAEEPVRAGDEVCNNYGDKGNEELCLCFGFAVPGGRNDSVALTVAAFRGGRDPSAPARRRVARAAGLLRPRFHLTAREPLPAALLAAACVGLASAGELEGMERLAWSDARRRAEAGEAPPPGPGTARGGELDDVAAELRASRRGDDPLVDFDEAGAKPSDALAELLLGVARRDAALAAASDGRTPPAAGAPPPVSTSRRAAAARALSGLLSAKAAAAGDASWDVGAAADVGRTAYRRAMTRLYRKGQAELLDSAARAAAGVASSLWAAGDGALHIGAARPWGSAAAPAADGELPEEPRRGLVLLPGAAESDALGPRVGLAVSLFRRGDGPALERHLVAEWRQSREAGAAGGADPAAAAGGGDRAKRSRLALSPGDADDGAGAGAEGSDGVAAGGSGAGGEGAGGGAPVWWGDALLGPGGGADEDDAAAGARTRRAGRVVVVPGGSLLAAAGAPGAAACRADVALAAGGPRLASALRAWRAEAAERFDEASPHLPAGASLARFRRCVALVDVFAVPAVEVESVDVASMDRDEAACLPATVLALPLGGAALGVRRGPAPVSGGGGGWAVLLASCGEGGGASACAVVGPGRWTGDGESLRSGAAAAVEAAFARRGEACLLIAPGRGGPAAPGLAWAGIDGWTPVRSERGEAALGWLLRAEGGGEDPSPGECDVFGVPVAAAPSWSIDGAGGAAVRVAAGTASGREGGVESADAAASIVDAAAVVRCDAAGADEACSPGGREMQQRPLCGREHGGWSAASAWAGRCRQHGLAGCALRLVRSCLGE